MTRRRRPATVSLSSGDPSGYRVARLVVLPEGGGERSVTLGLKQVRIGAETSNDIVLDDPAVSRFHCEIRKTAAGYLVRDLDSTNGTRVGGVVVKEGILESGATLTVGKTRIRFVADDGRIEDVIVSERTRFGEVVGQSVRMREVFAVLERIAKTELTVLIGGETGSGKDMLARAIHAAGPRADKPFEVFDCGAVAPTLIESALFGHVKGAFTGAQETRDGAFVRAKGGTLFLDEIGELALELQPKLLRVLEERTVRPLGGNAEVPVDVRIVAATHRNLEQAVREGKLRQDLYFRLSVVTVEVPPLRERIEDLPLLIERLLESLGKKVTVAPEALSVLERYEWPGNIRELRNVVESAAAVCEGDRIERRHLVFFRPQKRELDGDKASLAGRSLESIERAAIEQTLKLCEGNKTRAAKELGISPSTLYEKIKKYRIS